MPSLTILGTAHIHIWDYLKVIQRDSSLHHPLSIWDHDIARGKKIASQCGSKFVERLEDAIQDKDVDGFVICAENSHHVDILTKTLPLRKPIMCEKPLGISATECRTIQSLVEEFETPLVAGYFLPFEKGIQDVLTSIQTPSQIGTVTHVSHKFGHCAAYEKWFHDSNLMWFTDAELSFGGALLDLGTHCIHLLRLLFGKVMKVWGNAENLTGVYPLVEDYGNVLLKFESGVTGSIQVSWCDQGKLPPELHVYGSQGSVHCVGKHAKIVSKDGIEEVLNGGKQEKSRVELLIDLIKDHQSYDWMSQLMLSLDAVLIMEAVLKSIKSSTWETVQCFS